MKTIIPFLIIIMAGLLVTPMPIEETKEDYYEITVLQINAKWNEKNAVDINKLKNCNIEWAYLEDQSSNIQEKFQKIPFIVLKKNGEPLRYWEGNILFEPTVTVEEIQTHINEH